MAIKDGGREKRESVTAVSLDRMLYKMVKRLHPSPALTFPACISKLVHVVRFEKADGVEKGRLICIINVN